MKLCSNCKDVLPKTAFNQDRSKKDSLGSQCRLCIRGLKPRSVKARKTKKGRISLNCDYCSVLFSKYKSLLKKHNFCCEDHYYKWLSDNIKGDKNPNFGNHWSVEQREAQSKITSERMLSAEVRYKVGSANRGKKFTPERIHKMHGHRLPESYSRSFSDETRRKIGIASKLKFKNPKYRKKLNSPKYRAALRKSMEAGGYWIPLTDKSDYEIYYMESNWIHRMWNLVDDRGQLQLLTRLKVFHPIRNSKGVVRDHMFMRSSGFKNKVFPEILRHPCNLQILTHSENSAKRKNTLKLNELFRRVRAYSGQWKEHKKVLECVAAYEDGDRWRRK